MKTVPKSSKPAASATCLLRHHCACHHPRQQLLCPAGITKVSRLTIKSLSTNQTCRPCWTPSTGSQDIKEHEWTHGQILGNERGVGNRAPLCDLKIASGHSLAIARKCKNLILSQVEGFPGHTLRIWDRDTRPSSPILPLSPT